MPSPEIETGAGVVSSQRPRVGSPRGMANGHAAPSLIIRRRLKRMAEILIELSDTELDAVAGGAGSATFTITNTASGTTATVSGNLTQTTTASSASQQGSFSSSST